MRTIIKSLLFFGLVAIATQASAQVHLSINFGPPVVRHEVVVQSTSPGMVWIPGYYIYNDQDRDYAWQAGRWEAPPAPRQVWSAPRYVRNGDHYDYYKGNWHDNGKHKGQNKRQGREGNGNEGHGNEGHGRN